MFISWRIITLQYCSGFSIHWHESAIDLHAFPIPIPHPTSLSTQSLWVFPGHQAQALVLFEFIWIHIRIWATIKGQTETALFIPQFPYLFKWNILEILSLFKSWI